MSRTAEVDWALWDQVQQCPAVLAALARARQTECAVSTAEAVAKAAWADYEHLRLAVYDRLRAEQDQQSKGG